jgi:hypothetical protein
MNNANGLKKLGVPVKLPDTLNRPKLSWTRSAIGRSSQATEIPTAKRVDRKITHQV